VNFYLRLFNVPAGETLPRGFTLCINPIVFPWEEGYGLDMEDYKDQTYDGTGSNWINRMAHTPWATPGGDWWVAEEYKQTFDLGTENIEIDISKLVEDWITGSSGGEIDNNGIIVRLTSSQENGNRSYYTKKFSARGSEYFFSRPIIEARWDTARKDQRGAFYVSSSTLSAADNLNTIYFYNYVRGQPTDLPNVGTGQIYMDVYPSASTGLSLTTTPNQPVTGGWVSTGIYSASFALDTNEEVVFDRWFSGSVYYHTGSFMPLDFQSSNVYSISKYVTSITNLQPSYCRDDRNNFRVFTREKNWNDTIYTRAVAAVQLTIVEDAYYRIFRVIDDKTVINYGTGSYNHTRLSYDASGSYFDLDMSLLESGYEYGVKFVFLLNDIFEEQPEVFTFRVE